MNTRQQNVDRDVVNGPKRDTSLHFNAFVKQTGPSTIQRCKIISTDEVSTYYGNKPRLFIYS